MGVAIGVTLVVYAGTLPGLAAYFELGYVVTGWFWGWVGLIVVVAVVPVWVGRAVGRRVWMPSYRKVRGV